MLTQNIMRNEHRILKRVLLLISVAGVCNGINIGAILDSSSKESEHIFCQTVEEMGQIFHQHFEPLVVSVKPNDPFQSIRAVCELLSTGVLGILGPSTPENSEAVRTVCDMKEVPQIDVHPDYRPIRGTNINLYPDPDVLRGIYVDVVDSLKWTSFTVLYEGNESLIRVKDLLKLRDIKSHKVILRQLDRENLGNHRDALKDIWKSPTRNIVIDCSIEILPTVLEQAQQIGLITDEYNFFITNLDFHTINVEPYKYSEANVTGIRLTDPENFELRALQDSLHLKEDETGSCKDSQERTTLLSESALIWDAVYMLLKSVNETDVMWNSQSLSCDNTDTREKGQSIINIMKSYTYKGLSGVVQFDQSSKRSDFSLGVFELREEGLVNIGNWTNQNKLSIKRTHRNSDNLDIVGLSNQTFIVITSLNEPYGMLKQSPSQLYGNDRYEGFGIDIIAELAAMENFNYTIIIREDGENGAKNKDTGKWSGMIGDLIDHKADLAIADLSITAEREEAVDFTPNFMNLGIKILYRKPTKAPPSFFSFFDPFAYEVWLLVAISFFGVAVSLFIIGRLCPSEWTNPYPCIDEPEYYVNQFSLQNAFWFVTGSIMQQGSEIAPIAISTRMIAGVWWFFTLIMVASYTANLAAFLTTEVTESAFDNVLELVERAEKMGIQYGAKKAGSTANFFRDSAQPEYRQIWEYMSTHNDVMVTTNKAGVEKAEIENYAFFMESSSIEYETQRRCNLTAYGNQLDEKGYGIAMRKNSWYRHSLASSMLILLESGKIEQLRRKWWEEQRGGGQCVGDDEGGESTALNLKSVGGIFGLTIAGVIFATILGVFEMLLNILRRSFKTKTPFRRNLWEELKFYCKLKKQVKPLLKNGQRRGSSDSAKTAEIVSHDNKN